MNANRAGTNLCVSRPLLLAASAVLLFPTWAAAQIITTEAVAPVPVASPWVLLALSLTLLAGGVWLLRRNGHHQVLASALVLLVGLSAAGVWLGPVLRAQLSVQFTNPAGETLAIPVTEIRVQNVLQGFQPVDFTNATAASLGVSAIDPPDFDQCFPAGLDAPIPAPDAPSGTQCAVDTILANGASCRVDVDAICKGLAAIATAVITVTPAPLTFAENGTGAVTVTTTAGSPVSASNVTATIPGGSNISVQSTTCGASLAPGASCQITFAATTAESTSVSVAGSNTAALPVTVTVTSQATIAITGPVASGRVVAVSGSPLNLVVTNNSSTVAATNITVVDKSVVPSLIVDDSNCVNVAPAASCNLQLSSSTPYAPGQITIGGSNTANSPTTMLSFAYLGGLVFQESGGAGKVVIDVSQEFSSQWTGSFSSIAGATSASDGVANTNAIVSDSACSGAPGLCAAQRCRDIGAEWYLPAHDELTAVWGAVCSNAAIPCSTSGFLSAGYWSSTQLNASTANGVSFPTGITVVGTKTTSGRIRCVRQFAP